MELKRYISQDQLPSRTGTSPVDFQDYGRTGAAIDNMGKAVRSFGMDIYNADASSRAKALQQEQHRLRIDEDLAVQEQLTTFKANAAEIIQRRRESYAPGASEEEPDITSFAKGTIGELTGLLGDEKYENMNPLARNRFKKEALAHVDSLIPKLNDARNEMLIQRNEARLGQSAAIYEHRANLTDDPMEQLNAIHGYSEDLQKSVANGTLSPDKAVERGEKFGQKIAESWFNAKIGTDPEGLFRSLQAPLPEEAALLAMIGGKDRTGFTHDHERRVMDGIEQKRKDDEHKLAEKNKKLENEFWDQYFSGSFEQTKALFLQQQPELHKLNPERYKTIVKELQDTRDVGGKGDEELMNRWKTALFHSADALGHDEIARMKDLNWKQKQALYEAKRTATSYEHARASDPKHFSNQPNYKFYSGELGEQLGVIKLSPFTDAAARQVLSQAEIAYRTEYERMFQEKKGNVSQEEAKVLMQQIVTTARTNLGLKAKVSGELPRFTDPAMLQAAKDAGKITDGEYAKEWNKLKAWRAIQEDKEAKPKKDYKQHGKE